MMQSKRKYSRKHTRTNSKKQVHIMVLESNVIYCKPDTNALLSAIEDYIKELKLKEKRGEGKAEAIAALIRMGVLNEDGTQKDNIVSWE